MDCNSRGMEMILYPLLVPAGDDTQVQFNDGDLFGADSRFVFDKATGTVKVNGLTKLGDGGTTDYTEVEADGTLHCVGAATTWDDLRFPASAVRFGGAAPASEQAYRGGLVASFASTPDQYIYFNAQMPHQWKEGTDIHPHIHWVLPVSGAGGGAENVKWDLTYSWANIDSVFPVESSQTVTVDVQNDVIHDHMFDDVGAAISGTGKTFSSMLICSLKRDVSVANDYASAAYLVEFDFHYEIDTMGSRQEFVK